MPFLMVNARSKRAAAVLPAPARTLDDGGLQERVRLLTAAGGIGRVLDAGKVRDVCAAFGLAGGPAMTGAEAFEAVMDRGAALPLANGWRLARRRIMGAARVEIEDQPIPTCPRLRTRCPGSRTPAAYRMSHGDSPRSSRLIDCRNVHDRRAGVPVPCFRPCRIHKERP